jgi:hypothetical protein
MMPGLTIDQLEALCAHLERELSESLDVEWLGDFGSETPNSIEWRAQQRRRIAEVRAEIERRGAE